MHLTFNSVLSPWQSSGVGPNIERGSCKKRFIRNNEKIILIWIYKLGDNNMDLALGLPLIVRGE